MGLRTGELGSGVETMAGSELTVICSIWFVLFVWLVALVRLVRSVQPNKQNEQNKPNNVLFPEGLALSISSRYKILHGSYR